MERLEQRRQQMVERQLRARGITDPNVLRAMGEVPRHEFVAPDLIEFAYLDTALPIQEGQTISQPYVVALMTQALELSRGDSVLEVGTGSGYSAAVLAQIADQVYTIERHAALAEAAQERCRQLGYDNIHVRHGDGTLGWAEHAPYDAIVVTAGGPEIPDPLLAQLAVGGRLVIPTGRARHYQDLIRVRRVSEDDYDRENMGPVAFVPLIGARGWEASPADPGNAHESLTDLMVASVEPIPSIEDVELEDLLERIGDARVVLIGEASHGTAEFYAMRARITQELIEQRGYNIVAVEADWPDAAWIDRYVRGTDIDPGTTRPFSRFPTWMWSNTQVLSFVQWLEQFNRSFGSPDEAVGFYGLDLYSLQASIAAVLEYLEQVDPETARTARLRYGCLTPYEQDPATYGAAALSGRYRECEPEVVAMLQDLLNKRSQYIPQDGRSLMDAEQNARLVADAERYYRTMYYGGAESWNLRDQHMFDTLLRLLRFRGPAARAVVWAHNSHLGDAAATSMAASGEHNVGQLCRQEFGYDAYLIGFGTDHGTVAAASEWNGPMKVIQVPPAHARSYERLCHDTGLEAFLLPLSEPPRERLRDMLLEERLERAIGVVYRPESELYSHYFEAVLANQFDEFIWFDETRAVTSLGPQASAGMSETFPFGAW